MKDITRKKDQMKERKELLPFLTFLNTLNKPTTTESTLSEARKRGSGRGSPRKYDDLPTGPSDLDGTCCYEPVIKPSQ